jgi:hypothetical protein
MAKCFSASTRGLTISRQVAEFVDSLRVVQNVRFHGSRCLAHLETVISPMAVHPYGNNNLPQRIWADEKL